MADEIVIDEYTLINHISTGSSTQLWEAVEKNGGDRRWAMKLLLPEALADSEQRSVLKHEAKLAERFDHPNFVRFNKLVMNKKRGYFLMEYFRAPNLKAQLQSDGVSLQIRVARMFEQLCQALGYLHDQGWVHRDVKPDNILFNKGSELRLIDFSLTTRAASGVSKLIGGKEKVIQGTRTYISPETILKAPPSPQADIYSLGVTLFEVLTGEPPFRGTSPDDLLKKHLTSAAPAPSFYNENVTPEMDRFVLKMLAKKPKNRHKNTHEMLAEFRNINPFKEDPAERDRRLKKEQHERHATSLDKSGRLDSRADHLKQQLLKENPQRAREEAERKRKEEAEKKQAAAKVMKKLADEKAAASKPAAAPSAGSSAARAAPPASAPPAPPMPPQAPPMSGYPAGYGYPGHMAPAYPMAGYSPQGGYPPMPGGYPPQPGYYPQQAGYPPGYPSSGYPGQAGGGYPQAGFPPAQPPIPPHQMPQPPGTYAPGRPPIPGYPGAGPGQQPGAPPYGSQSQQPTPFAPPQAPATPTARPGLPPSKPAPGQPPIDEQQQLLQQLLGQPGTAPAGSPGRPQAPAPGQQRVAQKTAQNLPPLMDQLPPVK